MYGFTPTFSGTGCGVRLDLQDRSSAAVEEKARQEERLGRLVWRDSRELTRLSAAIALWNIVELSVITDYSIKCKAEESFTEE